MKKNQIQKKSKLYQERRNGTLSKFIEVSIKKGSEEPQHQSIEGASWQRFERMGK